MPRALFSSSKWRLLSVPKDELKCGDLIFLTTQAKAKLLGHIVFALGNGRVFHCNFRRGTAHTESIDECLTSYEQRLSARESLRYIDPRDKKLRDKNKGKFIQ